MLAGQTYFRLFRLFRGVSSGPSRLTELVQEATLKDLESRLVFRWKGEKIMNWETPSFVEIDMSAEIGSYQGEDDNGL